MGEKEKPEATGRRIVRSDTLTFLNDQEEAIQGLTTEYPYIMHITDFGLVVPWHWHEEVEFGYITSGEVEIRTADHTYRLKKNQGYFMNGNVLSSIRKATDDGRMNTHLFHPVFLSGHFRSLFQTKYIDPVIHNRNLDVIILDDKNETQREILKKLKQVSYLQREEDVEFQTRNYFSDIWLLLLKVIKTRPVHAVNLKNQDRIQTMLSFIQQNYMEKISLNDIASSAAVSTRECIRCFQQTIKKSPMEYLMEFRLEAAKRLLTGSDMSVTEISLQTGFSSNAYFGKVFREKCGTTPVAYRSNAKD